nr:uncharacterized protein LOC109178464 [Ipomoea trifida]
MTQTQTLCHSSSSSAQPTQISDQPQLSLPSVHPQPQSTHSTSSSPTIVEQVPPGPEDSMSTQVPSSSPSCAESAEPSEQSDTQSAQPIVVSRSQRVRRPNPKYFNDKFLNVTTKHPVASSIEPRTVSEALQNSTGLRKKCGSRVSIGHELERPI